MTQREFAKMLNISQATVSMALKDSPEISLKMRHHVQAYAKKLGYRPNLAGQLLRGGKSNLIGVVMPPLRYSFYAELLDHLYFFAQKKGYVLLLEDGSNQQNFPKIKQAMSAANVSALITSDPWEYASQFIPEGIPTVLLANSQNHLDPDEKLPIATIREDLYERGKTLGEYLIRQGRKQIVFAGMGRTEEARYRGVRDACKGKVGFHTIDTRINTPAEGYRIAGEIIRDFNFCDAVVAHNDDMAIGMLSRFYKEKISIPEKFAVAGFDNIAAGEYSAPALTTIGPDFSNFAEQVINTVIELITTGKSECAEKIKWNLIIRDSV